MKISGIYKITNTITNDFYIGSSKDVKRRWAVHKCQSTWNDNPNKQLYQDMKKYGLNNFEFQVIAEVEVESLKEAEQRFIEKLKPTYNDYRANGRDAERYKESRKEYHKSDKYKESKKEYNNKYDSQLCLYNGEYLTFTALRKRFMRRGIPHPTIEAKKYLLQ